MKRLLIFTISIAFITCNNLKDQGTNPVSNFQKQIIKEGLTGSNSAMIYKNGEILYNEAVNSSEITTFLQKLIAEAADPSIEKPFLNTFSIPFHFS